MGHQRGMEWPLRRREGGFWRISEDAPKVVGQQAFRTTWSIFL